MDGYVSVFVGGSWEVGLICAFLSSNGIEARVFDDVLASQASAFGSGSVCSAQVAVRNEDAKAAKELLAERR